MSVTDSSVHRIAAAGIALTLDLGSGMIRDFEVNIGGHRAAPLHRAPWLDEPAVTTDISLPPHLRALSGDFFCAPFGASDTEPAPPHGWPANAPWQLVAVEPHLAGGATHRFSLTRRVCGAQVLKELTVRDGHPFVYCRHVFLGGGGAVPVASHAMIALPHGGTLSVSAKQFAETPDAPLEPDPARGRSILAYPARFTDLSQAPLAGAGTADLRRYPLDAGHEDFVMLVEAAESRLGWGAVVRDGCGDLFLSLKNPRVLPATFLWFSNGGRRYHPWNGRHAGVLGVEEGRAFSLQGHAASAAANRLSSAGIPTALALDPHGAAEVRHVLGAIPVATGVAKVRNIETADDALHMTTENGQLLSVPFDTSFLESDTP